MYICFINENMQIVAGLLNERFYDTLAILEKPFLAVRDTGVSSRMIKYYDDQGLLYNSDDEPNMKRRFGLIQLCWLRILKELLEFGYEAEKIHHLKRGLETFEYSDRTKGRFYDTLTFHIALMAAYQMDFRLILNKSESFAWTIFSNTHQKEYTSKGFLPNEATLTIPFLPKIASEWESVTGETLQLPEVLLSQVEVEEKQFLEALRDKTIFKMELSFPDNFQSNKGKGKVLQTISADSIRQLGELLRHMKHAEVRLTYADEPGIPIYGSIAKTIKFQSRKDAVKQIIKRTK
jgi:DNA-binding transcriptional MerR regulator